MEAKIKLNLGPVETKRLVTNHLGHAAGDKGKGRDGHGMLMRMALAQRSKAQSVTPKAAFGGKLGAMAMRKLKEAPLGKKGF